MDAKKIGTTIGFMVIFAIATMIFWKQPLFLCGIVVLLAYVKHLFLPIKKELIWFIVIGILGSTFENIIIFSGAWYYPHPFFINVPLWLPFLWGAAGSCGISMYSGILGKEIK